MSFGSKMALIGFCVLILRIIAESFYDIYTTSWWSGCVIDTKISACFRYDVLEYKRTIALLIPRSHWKAVRQNKVSKEKRVCKWNSTAGYGYWLVFQDYAVKIAQFAKNSNRRKQSMDHWMNFSVGSSACHIAVSLIQQRNELVVEIYISEDKRMVPLFLIKRKGLNSMPVWPLTGENYLSVRQAASLLRRV